MELCTEILEDLKNQKKEFLSRQEQIKTDFNQILGAIFALDAVIKKIEEKGFSAGDNNDQTNNTEEKQPI